LSSHGYGFQVARPWTMSTVEMLSSEGLVKPQRARRRVGAARLLRPALGLLVPVAPAGGWGIIVGTGLSSGRLVPPPSVIFSTFADLAATGELQRHATVTLLRVLGGFGGGVVVCSV